MKTSPRGKNFIKSYESLKLTGYLPTPKDVPTIGYGHTGKGVEVGRIITPEEAEDLLDHDLAASESMIDRQLSFRRLNQNQFDALVSFVFNVGATNFLKSHLLSGLLTGTEQDRDWLTWCHQGGVELLGLKRRREAEWKMFMTPMS